MGAFAIGVAPVVSALSFDGHSWLRATDEEWSAGRSNSEIHRIAEMAREGDVDAMRQMGIISIKGQKVKQSTKIAIQWWQKAADEGDSRSMMYLGDLYRSGNGVSRNERRALEYYVAALEAADWDSDDIPDDEHVVIKRIKKLPLRTTLSWWENRCKDGNTQAMYYLGSLKKKNREGLISDEAAHSYLVRAAEAGHPKAKMKLERLAAKEHRDAQEEVEEVTEAKDVAQVNAARNALPAEKEASRKKQNVAAEEGKAVSDEKEIRDAIARMRRILKARLSR